MYGNTTVDYNHTDQTLGCVVWLSVVWLRLVRVCSSLVLLPSPTLKPRRANHTGQPALKDIKRVST